MADLKISQLTSATLPLAGTEVLPIVQSSSTKKVAADDLTVKNVRSNATTGILQIAGPSAGATRVMTVPDANFTAARTDAAQSFTGDQTLSTGNLIQGTAAKGFNFTANTPAAGMTSQLLNWYEEGTWTPVLVPGSGTITNAASSSKYVRAGRMVHCSFRVDVSAISSPSGSLTITGLPFTSAASSFGSAIFSLWLNLNTAKSYIAGYVPASATLINVTCGNGSVASLDNTADASIIGSSTILIGTVSYQAA